MDSTNELIYTAFCCYEVQQAICRHLPLQDLKSLRLVDKNWMQIAFTPLKDRSQVNLSSPESFSNYFDFLSSSNISGFANFKISFKCVKFNDNSQVCDLFQQLWDGSSDVIKELYITMPWICTLSILSCIYASDRFYLEKLGVCIEDVESIENWTVPETDDESGSETNVHVENLTQTGSLVTSLVSLYLNVSIVLTSNKKVFPFTWIQFFQRCPNVRRLCIQSDYGSGHIGRIINALAENNMWLTTLKIGTRDKRLFSDEFIQNVALLTTNRMEVVSLGFLPSVRHGTLLDTILVKASSSLKQLSLLQYRTSNQTTVNALNSTSGPSYPTLTSVRITKELVSNLHFLSKMPKISRLEIYRDSTIGQHDALSNPVIRTRSLPVIPTLETLALEMFVPVEHVWKLVKWFPNIQRVQIKANDVVARVIFMNWKEIKELYLIAEIARDTNDIVRSTLTDEGITGISKEILSQYSEKTDNTGHSIDISSQRNSAYIGNLTKLEVCKLQVVPDYQTGLTDYSISYGLTDVNKLRSLALIKSLVSEAGVDSLRRRGVSVTISKD